MKNLKLDSPSEVKTEDLLPVEDVKVVSENDDSDLEFGDFVSNDN